MTTPKLESQKSKKPLCNTCNQPMRNSLSMSSFLRRKDDNKTCKKCQTPQDLGGNSVEASGILEASQAATITTMDNSGIIETSQTFEDGMLNASLSDMFKISSRPKVTKSDTEQNGVSLLSMQGIRQIFSAMRKSSSETKKQETSQ